MNGQLTNYIKQNMMMVMTVVVLGFVLLVAGEYYLYRQIMHLNKMVSEGFFQVKEMQTDEIMMEDGDDVMLDESDAMMER